MHSVFASPAAPSCLQAECACCHTNLPLRVACLGASGSLCSPWKQRLDIMLLQHLHLLCTCTCNRVPGVMATAMAVGAQAWAVSTFLAVFLPYSQLLVVCETAGGLQTVCAVILCPRSCCVICAGLAACSSTEAPTVVGQCAWCLHRPQ